MLSPPTWDFSSSEVPRAITLPWSMTAIRSASRSASSRYWVVSSSVVPAATRSAITSHIPARPRGSRPVVGSSRKSTGGFATRAPARSSRRRIPPDQPLTTRPAASVRSNCSSSSSARCAAGLRAEVVEPPDHVEVLEPGEVLVHRGVLAGHADPAAQRLAVAGRRRARARSRSPASGLQQGGQHPDRGRLPRPVGAQEAHHGALLDLEVEPVEGRHVAVPLLKPRGLDHVATQHLRLSVLAVAIEALSSDSRPCLRLVVGPKVIDARHHS